VGENLITATVWNWGIFAPVAQMSDRTAFLLESEATGTRNQHPAGWQVEIEDGHRALDRSSVDVKATSLQGREKRSMRRFMTGLERRCSRRFHRLLLPLGDRRQ